MKRKNTLKCAAANDEDFEDFADEKPKRPKVHKIGQVPAPEVPSESETKRPPRKKEKEFAWMDSDDDDEGKEEVKDEKEKADGGDAKGSRERAESHVDVSVEALDAVTEFGQMVRLAPSLQAKLKGGRMDATNIAAAYRALGRVKFFDGEILESINREFRHLLQRGKATDEQTCDVMTSLGELNMYDRELFSSVAKVFTPKILTVQPAFRNLWYQVFTHFKHRIEKDFYQMLETAPMPPGHAGYKKLRCVHDQKGSCALGASCTFSHDPRAPVSMTQDMGLAPKNQILTQCQLLQGRGAYTTQPIGVNVWAMR